MEYYVRSVIPIIESNYNKLTTAEKNIADFFIHNQDKIDFSSENIAKLLYTSKPTLSRFAKKLGYHGYREFIYQYEETFIEKKENITSNTRMVLNTYQELLNKTYNLVNESQINRIAGYLNKAGKILVCGCGSSGFASKEFEMRFMRIGADVDSLTDPDMIRMSSVFQNKNSLVFGFSLSAGRKEVLYLLEEAHKKGAKTVLFTASNGTDFDSYCTEVVLLPSLKHLNHGNLISPQFPILVILDIIYACYAEQNKHMREGMHDSTLRALEGEKVRIGGIFKMIIDNVKVYTPEQKFVKGGLILEQDRIEAVYTDENKPDLTGKEILDGNGAYAIPGLIDLHFHGCKGDDFCDNSMEALERIAEYEASVGVTAIAPATMTLPAEELVDILKTAARYKQEKHDYKKADLVGINMEGPFISPAKKGAQDEKNILPCDINLCKRFLEASEGLVKFIGIAPEESENSLEFIQQMKDKVDISLAHTNADYDTAMTAFNAGANHAVHLYNAMPEILHRSPGVVGAVFDSKHVMAEIICDGIHIHPATVRATFQMMGADRMILISDSMRATGMPDGQYTLGGLDVKVVGKLATLVSDGAIAGSATNLADCMRTVVKKMDIPLETAVACATINPAKSLRIDDEYGSLEQGKKANVVLLGKDLELIAVIKDGLRI